MIKSKGTFSIKCSLLPSVMPSMSGKQTTKLWIILASFFAWKSLKQRMPKNARKGKITKRSSKERAKLLVLGNPIRLSTARIIKIATTRGIAATIKRPIILAKLASATCVRCQELPLLCMKHTMLKMYAARNGHLSIIQWARQNGCDWDSGTCSAAARNGHLSILQWARKIGMLVLVMMLLKMATSQSYNGRERTAATVCCSKWPFLLPSMNYIHKIMLKAPNATFKTSFFTTGIETSTVKAKAVNAILIAVNGNTSLHSQIPPPSQPDP